MATRRERILRLLGHSSGLTDREITDQLEGHSAPQQPINTLCRKMAAKKIIIRKKRHDGLIGNYLPNKMHVNQYQRPAKKKSEERILRTSETKNHTQIENESLQRLISLGFERAGRWFWERDNLDFKLTQFSNEVDILYAFVVDGDPKYIGKSVQTLYKRIYFYKNPGPSQRTNIRVNEKLNECLKQGSSIDIYIFVQKMPLMYLDIPINLAAGLEDNLISSLKPEWNLR